MAQPTSSTKGVSSLPSTAQATGGPRSFSPPANMKGSRVTPARRIPTTSRFSAAASGFPGLIPQSHSMGQVTGPTSAPAVGPGPTQGETQALGRDPSPTSSSGSSPKRRPGPSVLRPDEGRESEKLRSVAATGYSGDNSKSAPKSRPRYTSALATGPGTGPSATATSSCTGAPAALPSPSLGLTVNLATAKSTPNAQTAATRRRLQGGFGEMVPSFQRNAADRVPFVSSNAGKAPAVTSARPSMVSSASAQSLTNMPPPSLPSTTGAASGMRPVGQRLRRSVSHHIKDSEAPDPAPAPAPAPAEERAPPTRVPRRSETIRKRTTVRIILPLPTPAPLPSPPLRRICGSLT